MFDRFSQQARKVMKIARDAAFQMKLDYIGTELILVGLIEEDEGIASAVLRQANIKSDDVKKEITANPIANPSAPGTLPFTIKAKRALESSVECAAELRHNFLGPEHLLLGIITDENNQAAKILVKLGADLNSIKTEIYELIGEPVVAETVENDSPEEDYVVSTTSSEKENKVDKKKAGKALTQFGRDLTQLAREGKLDPVIGRKNEIERILMVLSRRTKNNPIIIGSAGTGKTAIVEGIAQQIVDKDVPQMLLDYQIISLDLAAIVAGTKYRGQFEERIKAVVEEVKKSKVILFIDEIHTLIGAGGAEGAIDASNVLKPSLSRGEIHCIGATTIDEYRKSIEKDGALDRRFQKIVIEPSTSEQTEEIIRGLLPKYENFHNVIYTDGAIKASVSLSSRYITNRFLPDKAIDVIDEAGARSVMERNRPTKLIEMEKKLTALKKSKAEASDNKDYKSLADYATKVNKLEDDYAKLSAQSKKDLKKTSIIDEQLVAKVVAKMTGIPLDKLTTNDTQKLLDLENQLNKTVIGQEKAKSALCKALRRSRAGLSDPKRPIFCGMLLGPTGVGKSLLVKELAKNIFGSDDALITIDCSEYMEKHNVSRLVGAPPGYIGFDEGGQLTEAVRRRQFAVVLFDEIEKAHADFYNILLQIMEEGQLTDSSGRKVDFKNTIIVMTSNVGSEAIKNKTSLGFGDPTSSSEEIIEKQIEEDVNNTFKIEFLNRLDGRIIFRSLTKEELVKILDIELDKIRSRLIVTKRQFSLTEPAKELLLKQGWNPDLGARPLRRAVSQLEDLFAEEILKNNFKENSKVVLDVKNEKFVIV